MKNTFTVLVRRDGKDLEEVKSVVAITSVDGNFNLTHRVSGDGVCGDYEVKIIPSDCEIIISGTDDDAVNIAIAKNDPQD